MMHQRSIDKARANRGLQDNSHFDVLRKSTSIFRKVFPQRCDFPQNCLQSVRIFPLQLGITREMTSPIRLNAAALLSSLTVFQTAAHDMAAELMNSFSTFCRHLR